MIHYDAIFVGTGFASSFFLHSYLASAPASARILVLERGARDPHSWQLAHRRNSSTPAAGTFVNRSPTKQWVFNVGFGGGSSCWTAGTTRLMPNDFRMQSTYGIGRDWPISYAELEPYYQQAERIMAVSGPDDSEHLFPRSAPYPQPPHRFSRPDALLKQAFPDSFFQQPTARARLSTGRRPACCGNAVCVLCPVGAKFTIENELGFLYADPRVELHLLARAMAVHTAAGVVSGVSYEEAGAVHDASADLVVLGANAIFNAHLLLRSGFRHPLLGRLLHEQAAVDVTVHLNGIDNVGGSTLITGQGYMYYDGPHRRGRAATMVSTLNPVVVRLDHGKWRQHMHLTFSFESLGLVDNAVSYDPAQPDLPVVEHRHLDPYTQRAIDRVPELVNDLLSTLPVESITIGEPTSNEAHIIGTTVMGHDPASSVLDRHLAYHGLPNLVVLGSGAFPTSAPVQPTLTIAALALWAADRTLR